MRGLTGLDDPPEDLPIPDADIVIGEPQHAEALGGEPSIADGVTLRVMEWPIRLDDQSVP